MGKINYYSIHKNKKKRKRVFQLSKKIYFKGFKTKSNFDIIFLDENNNLIFTS